MCAATMNFSILTSELNIHMHMGQVITTVSMCENCFMKQNRETDQNICSLFAVTFPTNKEKRAKYSLLGQLMAPWVNLSNLTDNILTGL